MKEFDPNHLKWQICCCHVTTAAYLVGSVELLVATVVAIVLIPLSINAHGSESSQILYASASGIALIWSVGEVVLLCDIRLRHVHRMNIYVFVQGIVFILMLFLIISIFLARQLRHYNDAGEEITYSGSMFSIVMALFFAAGATAATIYSIYVLLLLRRYMDAEKKHMEVVKKIQSIVKEQSPLES
ncbi:hypothetical protein M514_06934, partial [Trichuris suis]